jgi:hypothetical protein
MKMKELHIFKNTYLDILTYCVYGLSMANEKIIFQYIALNNDRFCEINTRTRTKTRTRTRSHSIKTQNGGANNDYSINKNKENKENSINIKKNTIEINVVSTQNTSKLKRNVFKILMLILTSFYFLFSIYVSSFQKTNLVLKPYNFLSNDQIQPKGLSDIIKHQEEACRREKNNFLALQNGDLKEVCIGSQGMKLVEHFQPFLEKLVRAKYDYSQIINLLNNIMTYPDNHENLTDINVEKMVNRSIFKNTNTTIDSSDIFNFPEEISTTLKNYYDDLIMNTSKPQYEINSQKYNSKAKNVYLNINTDYTLQPSMVEQNIIDYANEYQRPFGYNTWRKEANNFVEYSSIDQQNAFEWIFIKENQITLLNYIQNKPIDDSYFNQTLGLYGRPKGAINHDEIDFDPRKVFYAFQNKSDEEKTKLKNNFFDSILTTFDKISDNIPKTKEPFYVYRGVSAEEYKIINSPFVKTMRILYTSPSLSYANKYASSENDNDNKDKYFYRILIPVNSSVLPHFDGHVLIPQESELLLKEVKQIKSDKINILEFVLLPRKIKHD